MFLILFKIDFSRFLISIFDFKFNIYVLRLNVINVMCYVYGVKSQQLLLVIAPKFKYHNHNINLYFVFFYPY